MKRGVMPKVAKGAVTRRDDVSRGKRPENFETMADKKAVPAAEKAIKGMGRKRK